MSRIIIPTSADWASVNFGEGLCMVEGRLAQLEHPELWDDCIYATSQALDPHPWDYSGRGVGAARAGGVADNAAWAFNGTDGLIETQNPNLSLLPIAGLICQFTVMAHWNTRVLHASNAGILECTNAPASFTRMIAVRHNSTGTLTWFIRMGANLSATTAGAFGAGVWRHTALVGRDLGSDEVRLYVDAVTASSMSGATNYGTTPPEGTMYIGATRDARYLNSLIDDVRVYRRPLDQSVVANLSQRRNIAYECKLLPRVFLPSAAAPPTGFARGFIGRSLARSQLANAGLVG